MKTLTEADLSKYTIFDVIMPLPGRDVAFPGGPLGERYREFLKTDGLDPDNFERKQRSVCHFRPRQRTITDLCSKRVQFGRLIPKNPAPAQGTVLVSS